MTQDYEPLSEAALAEIVTQLADSLFESRMKLVRRILADLDYWHARALAAERRPQIRCPLCTDKHDPETDCAE